MKRVFDLKAQTKNIKPTNRIRAAWAGATLEGFRTVSNSKENDQTALTDLLSDLMHLCDRNQGLDFDEALAVAKSNWKYELIEEQKP